MAYTDGMLKDGALKGRTILITGGGTGLGKSMGKYFLQLGANLVITSRKLDVLQKTAAQYCPVFNKTSVQASSVFIPLRSAKISSSLFSAPGLKIILRGFAEIIFS